MRDPGDGGNRPGAWSDWLESNVSEVTPRSREALAWLAGFWDGEGCVSLDKRHATPLFSLTQAGDEGEALCRRVLLASGIKGGVYPAPAQSRRRNWKPYYRVMVVGHQRVQALLAMCWPWLSDTKRAQAQRALDVHRERKRNYVNHFAAKTHCPHGHPYSEENTLVVSKSGGGVSRTCRTCRGDYAERNREAINARSKQRYHIKRIAAGAPLRALEPELITEIRHLLATTTLRQVEIAKRCGVHQSTVSRVKLGRHRSA